MSRELTTKEKAEVKKLADKIQVIVDGASDYPDILTPAVGNYAEFSKWFRQLPHKLEELIAAGKVVVNEELNSSTGANAITGKPNVTLEISKEMVSGDKSKLTDYAIMLVHELTHTMYQTPVFPIVDFNYREYWGYLPPDLSSRNADTYAEGAALIAEQIEKAPNRYRAIGRIRAQREALQQLPLLAHALAWADLAINRAWLRSRDYEAFAKDKMGRLRWQEALDKLKHDEDSNRLREIEEDLHRKKIVGIRSGHITVDLDKHSQANAKSIQEYMTRLKNAMSKLHLSLIDQDGEVTFKETANLKTETKKNEVHRALTVPRNAVVGSVVDLGDAIVTAIVKALDYIGPERTGLLDGAPDIPALNNYKHDIVKLMRDKDRSYEKGHIDRYFVAGLPNSSAGSPNSNSSSSQISSGAPSQEAWNRARVDLMLAEARGIADKLQQGSYLAAFAAGPDGEGVVQYLDILDGDLENETTKAKEIGTALAKSPPSYGTLSTTQIQNRKSCFADIDKALTSISKSVTEHYPTKAAKYVQLCEAIRTFAS